MAESKRNFPMLPVAHWWTLRKKFQQSIPGIVTDNFLATVLEMTVDSARANVLPFLKTLGIVDEDGKPKDRAKLWRDNDKYSIVCEAILQEVYPKDLLDAVADPRNNRDAVKRWFANHTGAGDSACSRMAGLYTVLAEANPDGQPETKQRISEKLPKSKSDKSKLKINSKADSSHVVVPNEIPVKVVPSSENSTLGLHINIQVHISADSSPDQIEQIFASMAKHIYKKQ